MGSRYVMYCDLSAAILRFRHISEWGKAMQSIIAVQDVKRHGMGVVDGALRDGPVTIVRNNRPAYIVISPEEFESLESELREARVLASLAERKEGLYKSGNSADVMKDILHGGR